MGTSSGRRVGRPRVAQRADSGLEPRAELLVAAAELFTTHGYAATTTRAVAERAGMRQASMYHYVSGKEELLAELLESTVTPSLAYARELLADDAMPAGERLRALCRADVELLCAGPHNLGALPATGFWKPGLVSLGSSVIGRLLSIRGSVTHS
ncbi:helix-turn-helix domain-containing protein, partial [Streptomyces sp. NPDC005921]